MFHKKLTAVISYTDTTTNKTHLVQHNVARDEELKEITWPLNKDIATNKIDTENMTFLINGHFHKQIYTNHQITGLQAFRDFTQNAALSPKKQHTSLAAIMLP